MNDVKSTKYRNYTDEDIIRLAQEVKSRAGLLRSLGLKVAGGNYNNIKKHLIRLGVDTSHWTGQLWSEGEKLKDWTQYKKNKGLKPHLIKERGHRCEECLNVEWKGLPITLEIHHIDGDNVNNEYDNLQLLCPNCHSVTDNWRGRKNKKATLER